MSFKVCEGSSRRVCVECSLFFIFFKNCIQLVVSLKSKNIIFLKSDLLRIEDAVSEIIGGAEDPGPDVITVV